MTALRPIDPALLARALSRSRGAAVGIGLLAAVLVGTAVQWLAGDLRRQPIEATVSTEADGVPSRTLALPAPAGGGLAGRVAPPGSPGQGPAFGSEERDGRSPWSHGSAAPPVAGVVDAPGPPAGVLLVSPDRRHWRRANPPTGPPATA